MSKKGLELPLNMIVIIIIAVLVLLVIGAYFTGQFRSNTNTLSNTVAMNQGCNVWRQNQCSGTPESVKIPGYKLPLPGGGTEDGDLLDACRRSGYDVNDGYEQCRVACGCPS